MIRLGWAGRVGTFPVQFSGGRQQRVAIAPAPAVKPAALLFDEPTSVLDAGEIVEQGPAARLFSNPWEPRIRQFPRRLLAGG